MTIGVKTSTYETINKLVLQFIYLMVTRVSVIYHFGSEHDPDVFTF